MLPKPSRRLHLMALLLLALVAALPRFGQRENEASALSDSDYYLDMVQVFTGAAGAFHAEYSAPGHPGSKHYARPLLPLMAAPVVLATGMDPRVVLSGISVLSAWLVAAALYLLLAGFGPHVRLAWLPPALFLTGFPQVNWGYHILSDSLGYATAFGASLAAWLLLRWHRSVAPRPRLSDPRLLRGLVGLWAVQALALSARETGWFTPVVVLALVARAGRWRQEGLLAALVIATLLAAKLPHAFYVAHFGLEPVRIPLAPALWLDPFYVADFLVKSAVAFHVGWILCILAVRGRSIRSLPVPDLAVAWGVAALLYIAAGYAHNSREGVGYPLRMTYALFPLVYYLAAHALEVRLRPPLLRTAAVLLVVLNALIAGAGVALDPGRSVVVGAGAALTHAQGDQPSWSRTRAFQRLRPDR